MCLESFIADFFSYARSPNNYLHEYMNCLFELGCVIKVFLPLMGQVITTIKTKSITEILNSVLLHFQEDIKALIKWFVF